MRVEEARGTSKIILTKRMKGGRVLRLVNHIFFYFIRKGSLSTVRHVLQTLARVPEVGHRWASHESWLETHSLRFHPRLTASEFLFSKGDLNTH